MFTDENVHELDFNRKPIAKPLNQFILLMLLYVVFCLMKHQKCISSCNNPFSYQKSCNTKSTIQGYDCCSMSHQKGATHPPTILSQGRDFATGNPYERSCKREPMIQHRLLILQQPFLINRDPTTWTYSSFWNPYERSRNREPMIQHGYDFCSRCFFSCKQPFSYQRSFI